MQDNNEKDVVSVSGEETTKTEIVPEREGATFAEDAVVEKTEDQTQAVVANVTSSAKKNIKIYLSTALIVVVMGAGLLFILEKEGRIAPTGLFGALTNNDKAVATVNGTSINKSDYDSSLRQLLEMAAAQGASTTDEKALADLKTQAMETLVNGELLRQSAIAEGMKATPEAIDARFKEIEDGIGGAEALQAKMGEFNITEKILRRDIENEILIQGLIDSKFSFADSEVTEEEVKDLYDSLGGEKGGLPPLKEVHDKVVEQIKMNRQQEAIAKYIEELRDKAEIEIKI